MLLSSANQMTVCAAHLVANISTGKIRRVGNYVVAKNNIAVIVVKKRLGQQLFDAGVRRRGLHSINTK